ncbi:MAG: hypothetical protein AAFY36_05460 [Bacteroidota bacterium]
MMTRLLTALFLTLLLTSCGEQNDIELPAPLDPERINFTAPEVGQFNEYRAVSFTCSEAQPLDRGLLRWEVTEVSEAEIEILETFDGDEITTFTADRTEEGLLISEDERVRSNMLFFYGDDLIRLTSEPTAEVYQEACVFFDGEEKFTGEYVARADQYQLDDFTLRNMKVVSCVPTILDLDGYLMYTEHTLWASFTADNLSDDPSVWAFLLK